MAMSQIYVCRYFISLKDISKLYPQIFNNCQNYYTQCTIFTLQSPIVVQDIQLFMDHLVRPRQLIRAYPFMKKENFHPRQDVYYKNYTKLLSNISKTYHSKTFIVTIYFQDVYIFKKFPFNTSYHVLDYYQRLQSTQIWTLVLIYIYISI